MNETSTRRGLADAPLTIGMDEDGQARGAHDGPKAPTVPPPVDVQRRLAKRDFHIDTDAGTVTCPAGHVADIATAPSGQRRAIFAPSVRAACPLRDRCLGPKTPRRSIAARSYFQ
jgi:hypothetical protein